MVPEHCVPLGHKLVVPVGQLMSGCAVGKFKGGGGEELFHVVDGTHTSQVLLEQDLGFYSLNNAGIILEILFLVKMVSPVSFLN